MRSSLSLFAGRNDEGLLIAWQLWRPSRGNEGEFESTRNVSVH